MFGWLVVAMFTFISGWLAIMMVRERAYRNNVFVGKGRAKAGGKLSHLDPDSFHSRRAL